MGHVPVYRFQRYVVCAPPNVVLRTQLGRFGRAANAL